MRASVHLTRGDDGATLIEFFGPDRRFGFSFEVDEATSGWFAVSKAGEGFDGGSGLLTDDAWLEHLAAFIDAARNPAGRGATTHG